MKNEKDPAKITEGIERGKYIIKELEALHQLHKYRALKKSYYGSDPAEWISSLVQRSYCNIYAINLINL